MGTLVPRLQQPVLYQKQFELHHHLEISELKLLQRPNSGSTSKTRRKLFVSFFFIFLLFFRNVQLRLGISYSNTVYLLRKRNSLCRPLFLTFVEDTGANSTTAIFRPPSAHINSSRAPDLHSRLLFGQRTTINGHWHRNPG